MASDSKPTVDQVFAMMRKTMGSIPSAIEKATSVDEGLPFAASSKACTQAMANKAKMQGIAAEKVLETVRIVRFALATKVIGDGEPIFEAPQGVN